MPDFMHGVVTLFCSYTTLMLIIATLFEGIGGLFVLLGFKVRFGATLLILFIIPVTIIMHPFWLISGQEKMFQIAMFMKNLAILGGLLILAARKETES
jgi:putative oxidoreductase